MAKLKHCTEADCQKVIDFAVEFVQVLGLPHHWIKVDGKPSPRDTLASVEHQQQRYLVTIRLGRDWSELSEFERFHSVVHEVCHMLHRRVETAVREGEGLMHDHEWRDYWNRIVVELELMVDQLALAWCKVPYVRELWYGTDEPQSDPEAGQVG